MHQLSEKSARPYSLRNQEMSKTMKILLPVLIVFVVAAIAVNIYVGMFVKPKRKIITMPLPAIKEYPLPANPPTPK